MGIYFKPGNTGFSTVRSNFYIDRTGILDHLNSVLNTPENNQKNINDLNNTGEKKSWLICFSLPRRSGKTTQAEMIYSYYDVSCDSHWLFDGLAISKCASYEEHMNQYHVVRMDIASLISDADNIQNIVPYIKKRLKRDLLKEYEELQLSSEDEFKDLLIEITEKTKRKFIFVIDEWDAVIRLAEHDPDTQQSYLDLLRSWFKDMTFTKDVIAMAFMTGILPIKKDKGQSALSDFTEYSILDPGPFAPYIGLHKDEVLSLCEKKGRDPMEIEAWYEGYRAGDCHFYNPYSVINAVNGPVKSYWRMSSANETLLNYVHADFEGMQQDIANLIAGGTRIVKTRSFQNDTVRFTCKDDVFTLLVHLGYLTYEPAGSAETIEVKIPNEEVRQEFVDMIETTDMSFLSQLAKESGKLLEDTYQLNAKGVAEQIEKLHNSQAAPLHYNDEQALRYRIKFGYIMALEKYITFDELPSGRGYADVVLVPKRYFDVPVIIIELKWNKSAISAIKQIQDRRYQSVLENYGGEILFVGINYSTDTGKHTCEITRFERRNGINRVVGVSAD